MRSLTPLTRGAHNQTVPKTKGTGIGVPNDKGGRAALRLFFRPFHLGEPFFNGGPGGGALGHAGSFVPVRQPHSVPSPHWRGVAGAKPMTKECRHD